MKKAISYLLVFLGIQMIVGAIVRIAWQAVSKSEDTTTAMLIAITTVAGVIVIAVFLLARWAVLSPRWLRTRPWTVLCWSSVAALGALIPSVWLQEMMPELPNWAENEFEMLLGNRWGYLTIGLLAPLSEEIVMRGAILKELLKSTKLTPWAAIAISALLFSLIHMNPVQMPHAFVIGLLLGWMYWRTGSILPGVAYHWVNNSVAYVIYNVYPNPDIRLIDIFKGSQVNVWLAVCFSLIILLPAIYQLHLWMRRADEQQS